MFILKQHKLYCNYTITLRSSHSKSSRTLLHSLWISFWSRFSSFIFALSYQQVMQAISHRSLWRIKVVSTKYVALYWHISWTRIKLWNVSLLHNYYYYRLSDHQWLKVGLVELHKAVSLGHWGELYRKQFQHCAQICNEWHKHLVFIISSSVGNTNIMLKFMLLIWHISSFHFIRWS